MIYHILYFCCTMASEFSSRTNATAESFSSNWPPGALSGGCPQFKASPAAVNPSVFNSCQYSCVAAAAAAAVFAWELWKQKQTNSAPLSRPPSLLLHGRVWAMRRDLLGFFFFLSRVTWRDPEAFLRPTHRLSPLSGVTRQPVFSGRTLAWVKRQTVGGRHGVRRVALIFEQLVGAR